MSGTGWGTLPEVHDGTGDPLGGSGRVGGPSGRLGRVGRPSRWSGTGWWTLGEIGTGRETLLEV